MIPLLAGLYLLISWPWRHRHETPWFAPEARVWQNIHGFISKDTL